jgi:predicted nucleotidyltransferase
MSVLYTMDSAATDDAGIPLRRFLLIAAREFVGAAIKLNGISRIAMLGSLLTTKTEPKDADVLVTVKDGTDLTSLARLARRLKGRAQTRNRGADIFLADESARYIGRVCHWRECAPGIRMACRAQHCGRREFLHDDLQVVALSADLVRAPPLELWPELIRRVELPADVEELVIGSAGRRVSHP